ncbi:hypothetical protein CVT24_012264, partial [Panaeolus cyanescens]
MLDHGPIFPSEIFTSIIEHLFEEEASLGRRSDVLASIREKERLATIDACTHVCKAFKYICRPFYFRQVELGFNENTAGQRRFDHLLQRIDTNPEIVRYIRALRIDWKGTPPGAPTPQCNNREDLAQRMNFLLNIPNLQSLSLCFSKVSQEFNLPSALEVKAFCNRLIDSYTSLTVTRSTTIHSFHAQKVAGLPYDKILACPTLHTFSLDRCLWPVLKQPVSHLASLKLRKISSYIPISSLLYMPNLTELSLDSAYFNDDPADHNGQPELRTPLRPPYGLKTVTLHTAIGLTDQFHIFASEAKQF